MGYYVNTTDQQVFISKEFLGDLYQALIKLNDYDELKTGGVWGGGTEISYDSLRPEGMTYHPARWFSWLSPNYPEQYESAVEILQAVGFFVGFDDKGNITSLEYDNKDGCQDIFLWACAPFFENGSYITWRGEDGPLWQHYFQSGIMYIREAVTTFETTTTFSPLVK